MMSEQLLFASGKLTSIQVHGVLQYPISPRCATVDICWQSCSRDKKRNRSWWWGRENMKNLQNPDAKLIQIWSKLVNSFTRVEYFWLHSGFVVSSNVLDRFCTCDKNQAFLPGRPWQNSPIQQECDTPSLTGLWQRAGACRWDSAQWAESHLWTSLVQGCTGYIEP